MVPEPRAALRRLKELVRSRAAGLWLEEARVEDAPAGKRRLCVRDAFQKGWLETHFAGELREAFEGPVEIVAPATRASGARPARTLPRLVGPSGEYAVRVARNFVEGGPTAAPLVVVHGPPRSGKSVLAEWVRSLARGQAFHLDLQRLRSGRSRGLVPRKPLVVADGVEQLAGAAGAQRTLCTILDVMRDRGGRVLVTLEGHPAEAHGLFPALRNRLAGGISIRLESAPGECVEARGGAADARLEQMKRLATELFGVERGLLDSRSRKRIVVEARRAVMAAAVERGVSAAAVAAAFDLSSVRTVREACHWATRERARNRGLGTILHELGRVLPRE